VRKEKQDEMELKDCPDQEEESVCLVFPDSLDVMDNQEMKEEEENQVSLDATVQRESAVPRAHVVETENKVTKVCLVHLDPLVSLEIQQLPVKKDRRENQENQETMDPKVILEKKEKKVPLDVMVNRVFGASKVKRVNVETPMSLLLVSVVRKVKRVHQVHLEKHAKEQAI